MVAQVVQDARLSLEDQVFHLDPSLLLQLTELLLGELLIS